MVAVRTVGVHSDGLSTDQMIKIIPGLLAVWLAGLQPMGDLGSVDPEKADAEPGGVLGCGNDGVAVADPLHNGDERPRRGGVDRLNEGK